MRLLPLVAATYFMVAGGPYGIEDILGGAGFLKAILILLALPFLWSLPTALMIGELASALPDDGGYYVWVRRALGPFWGYQEGWLSLSASIFDMAIYPAIFVLYLGKFSSALTAGWHGYALSLAVVVLCCAWNLRGAPAVGEDSMGLFALLLAPFAVFVVLARAYAAPAGAVEHLVGWNGSGVWLFDSGFGGSVELHGLGQRLDGGAGGGESAAQLSPRHDLRHHSGGRYLRFAAGGNGAGRPIHHQFLNRRLGRRGQDAWRNGTDGSGARSGHGCRRRLDGHRHV
jgi:amino acid transporter